MLFTLDDTQLNKLTKLVCISKKLSLFVLDDTQLNKLAEWQENHTPIYVGAIGGMYTFSFTPTGIGVIIEVKNNTTGESINLTDYDSW